MKYALPLAALAVLIFAPTAQAQPDFGFVGYGGYNFQTENPMIGFGLDIDGLGDFGPIRGSAWVDIETQFEDSGSVIQADVNLTPKYDINNLELTVGVGFAWERFSPDLGDSNSNTGWNVLAGIALNSGSINPFARYRCSFFDGNSQETLFGGVRVIF